MRCENCGAELMDGVLFCRDCGAKVEIRRKRFCIECGAEYSEGAKFCSNCGASLDNTKKIIKPSGVKTDVQKESGLPQEGKESLVEEGIEPKDYISNNPMYEYTKKSTDSVNTVSDRYSEPESEDFNKYYSTSNQFKQKPPVQNSSLREKAKAYFQTWWESLDLFFKIVSIAMAISILLLLISFFSHKGVNIFLSLIQVGGLFAAIQLHKGRIKANKDRTKYVVVAAVFLFAILNVKGYLGNNDSKSNFPENVTSDRKDTNNVVSDNFTRREEIPTISDNTETNEDEGIYVYDIKNYIGKNLASFGEERGGYMVDGYGSGYLRLIYVTQDGAYLNSEDTESLQEYQVVDQNIEVGNKVVIVSQRDSDGNPYSSLVSYQNYEEIVLFVDKVGTQDKPIHELTSVMPTLDRHTWYVRDYVGRNIASFGTYVNKHRVDEYGKGELTLMFVSDDGSYIDPSSLSDLRQYYVTSQETEPNTEISYIYYKDSQGKEFDNLVESQSLEEIVLHVKKLDETIIATYKDLPSDNNNVPTTDSLAVQEKAIAEEGKIKVPESALSYKYEDYKDVQKSFTNAGFTNISTKIQYDIVWGWTDEGEVASVSIDGIDDFSEGDLFEPDAEVVITYHMKEEDDPSKQVKEETKEKTSEDSKIETENDNKNENANHSGDKGKSNNESTSKEEGVSYSTNTKDKVKEGNAGVYSYKSRGGSYEIYYIIDFDEGYVYSFTEGNGNDTCDRLKIESGDLNDVVVITYHDSGDEWSYGLHFKYKNQPDHLIMEDNDYFEYDYYSTNLDNALKIRDSKTIHDY